MNLSEYSNPATISALAAIFGSFTASVSSWITHVSRINGIFSPKEGFTMNISS
jgi:hypothetical protein